MNRREIIAGLGGVAAWPYTHAWAQQIDRVRRVGILSFGADFELIRTVLRDELAKRGWIENRNVQLDFRFGYDERQTTLSLLIW